MAGVRYLVDTSVFARLTKPAVAAAFAPLAAGRQVALSNAVAFELGFAARSADDYREVSDRLQSFPAVPTTDVDHPRALDIQGALAIRSQHRALSLVDALVAATAEARGLTVLHYDGDFELVAQITGQRHEWIVPPGTADGGSQLLERDNRLQAGVRGYPRACDSGMRCVTISGKARLRHPWWPVPWVARIES